MLYKDIIDNAKSVALKRDETKRIAFVNKVAEILKEIKVSDVDDVVKTFVYACKKGVGDLVVSNLFTGKKARFEDDCFINAFINYRHEYIIDYVISTTKNYVYFPIYGLTVPNDSLRHYLVIYKKNAYICINQAFNEKTSSVTFDMVKVLVQNKQTLINFVKSDGTPMPIIFNRSKANDIVTYPFNLKLNPEVFLECLGGSLGCVRERVNRFVIKFHEAFEALK